MLTLTKRDQAQRLAVADLATSEGVRIFESLLGGLTVTVVYSDPPWNPGNEKYWRTYAKTSASSGYDRFLDGWCACASVCNAAHIFVEQSVNEAHQGLLLAAIARCPTWKLPLLEKWTVLYSNPKRPNALLHFGNTKLRTDPSNLSRMDLVRTVFQGLESVQGTIADPCMGLGTTSRIAHEYGLNCVGTELNPARLDRTINWLKKHGYQ